jgi:chitodextrinase
MPRDSSGLIDYEIICAGRETVHTTKLEYIARDLIPEVPYLFEIQPRRTPDKPVAPSQSITVMTHDRVPPTRPKGLRVTEITSNSVALSWGASESRSGALRYRVYLNRALIAETDQLHFTIQNLRNLTVFRVSVRAIRTSGLAPASVPASIKFRTLLRPPILSFRQRNGIGKLSWAPNYWAFPTLEGAVNGHGFTTGALSLGYKFRVAERSSGPPYAFKFEVRAQADGVFSECSRLESTVDETIPPSQPGTPVVDAIGDTSVTLSWAPSTDNKEVTGYRLIRWGGGELYDTTVVADARCTYADLNSGSRYLFVVRAQDASGNESIPSEVMFKTTGPSVYPEPLAPKLTITPKTSASALLEWMFEAGGEPPTGVRITINGVYYSDVPASQKSELLKDLVPGDEYTITVYAYTFLAAQISEPATLVYEPKDVTPPSVPGALHVVEKKTGSVTLAWEASTDDIGMYGYVIYDNFEYCDETPDTQYTATHLYPGLHLFHVRALDIHGNASEPAVALVEVGERKPSPSRPGTPLVSELTRRSAKLTWAPSIGESEGAITYHVMRLAIGLATYKSTSSTETTYTGLPYGSRHFFDVRAIDEAGNVSPSSQLFFKLKGRTTPDLPAPILTLEPQPPTSVMLRWTYPGDYSPNQVSIVVNGRLHDAVDGSVVSMLLDNLDPVAQYSISVLASNLLPAQLSEPATLVYGLTQVAVTSISAALRVIGTSSDSVTLAWDGPAGGSGSHGYLVYHHHRHVGSTLGNRYTVTGLSPGAYSFSLRALDLDGNITELGTVNAQVTG